METLVKKQADCDDTDPIDRQCCEAERLVAYRVSDQHGDRPDDKRSNDHNHQCEDPAPGGQPVDDASVHTGALDHITPYQFAVVFLYLFMAVAVLRRSTPLSARGIELAELFAVYIVLFFAEPVWCLLNNLVDELLFRDRTNPNRRLARRLTNPTED